ncbi:transglutaminase family protein [Celeribacter litoreus]|uniref:transglutaminase family protein n=1 Tax=Celeribacter litoreus TaxID=2876714 RepID=UPI001CCDB2ED|nr:transglutaminase family protein [Celeribacter litoreus]MCA0042422.1 transglutaminase family protein [Celeribacter litoreus]
MRFTVRHETLYRYSAPVRLGDQVLRLKPFGVDGLDHSYDITPAPFWREDGLSPFGTPETRVGFDGETDVLKIVSRFTCETIEAIGPPPESDLSTYLKPSGASTVADFASELRSQAGSTDRFLLLLTETLYRQTDRHIRPTGYAQTSLETLETRKGACRDLAVLFIDACRSLGIPARFVSGYQAKAESVDGKRHLQAWPEAYLPDLGWRGFDPTHGVAVTDGHVPLSAAPDQLATMPIEGGFWGEGVSSELEFGLEIEAR